jgi:uncharacterized membrane protein
MKQALRIVLLAGIGLFFLASGILKLLDPVEFALAILRYRIVGESLAAIFALVVPWTEIVVCIGLCLKSWRAAALLLIIALLCVFELALASAWIRGLDIECGCMGSGVATSIQFAFFRNILLFLVTGWLYWMEGDRG